MNTLTIKRKNTTELQMELNNFQETQEVVIVGSFIFWDPIETHTAIINYYN